MLNLRDVVLMYPTERLVFADNGYCRITWFDIIKSKIKEDTAGMLI
jgi:hypothetical protein